MKLKTITLSDNDEHPLVSLCPGHVTAKEFNKAFVAEGWDHSDCEQDELHHEYFTVKNGAYTKCKASTKNAIKYTAKYWE